MRYGLKNIREHIINGLLEILNEWKYSISHRERDFRGDCAEFI